MGPFIHGVHGGCDVLSDKGTMHVSVQRHVQRYVKGILFNPPESDILHVGTVNGLQSEIMTNTTNDKITYDFIYGIFPKVFDINTKKIKCLLHRTDP